VKTELSVHIEEYIIKMEAPLDLTLRKSPEQACAPLDLSKPSVEETIEEMRRKHPTLISILDAPPLNQVQTNHKHHKYHKYHKYTPSHNYHGPVNNNQDGGVTNNNYHQDQEVPNNSNNYYGQEPNSSIYHGQEPKDNRYHNLRPNNYNDQNRMFDNNCCYAEIYNINGFKK